MQNDSSLLIGVVVVGFIAGYAIVSFLAAKIKAYVRSLRLGETETHRLQQKNTCPTDGRNGSVQEEED